MSHFFFFFVFVAFVGWVVGVITQAVVSPPRWLLD